MLQGLLLLGLGLVPAPRALLAPATNPAALARGLDAIRPEGIRADLTFLASDELAGRDTPSPGLRLAAMYLRARVARLGFTPAGEDGTFYDPYALDRVALDLERTGARLERAGEPLPLAFGEDYLFRADGYRDLSIEGPLVFVGDASADALRGLDLAGCVALALDDPHANGARRADALERLGAVGALYLQPPDVGYKSVERSARFARRQAQRGALRVRVVDLPEAFLTERGAERLPFDAAGARPGERLAMRFAETRARSSDSESHVVENVAALWPGSDPDLKHEVLVLSAHYDHVGTKDEAIYNGADDNGSGTSGLLAVADALAAYGPMRRSVLLLWVSGEEKGLKGSYAWTMAPTLPEGFRAVCDLNIDMIGRNAPDSLLITPTKARPEYNDLVRMAEEQAPREGFPTLGSCDEYWHRSDHMNFAENLEIPVAFLFSDVHEDYHQPTDTIEKIDFDKVHRVARLLVRVLDGLQEDRLFAR